MTGILRYALMMRRKQAGIDFPPAPPLSWRSARCKRDLIDWRGLNFKAPKLSMPVSKHVSPSWLHFDPTCCFVEET